MPSFPNFLRNTDRSYASLRGSPVHRLEGCCAAISPPREAPRRDSGRDKSAAIRSYRRERRGPLFALVSLDVRVPGNFTLRVTELRPRDPPCVISRSVTGFRRSCREAIISVGVVSAFPFVAARNVDLRAPCTVPITVPLENRYRLDLTITYRDHSPAFVKTTFQERRISAVPDGGTASGRDGLNWL